MVQVWLSQPYLHVQVGLYCGSLREGKGFNSVALAGLAPTSGLTCNQHIIIVYVEHQDMGFTPLI